MRMALHCPSCGAPLDASAFRCSYCGSAFKEVSSREQQEARLAELHRAVSQRKPTFDEALELGELHLALGQNAHAADYLQQAVDGDPRAPRPRLLLCLALLGFNQQVVSSRTYADEIKTHFQWLQKNHPDMPEVEWLGYYLELERLAKDGNWKRGVERGRMAVEKFPENYLLQFMYGLALARFGRLEGMSREEYKQALHRFRIAAELNPNFEPAVKNVRALEEYLAD